MAKCISEIQPLLLNLGMYIFFLNQKKHSVGPSNRLKTVNLDYHLSLSVAPLVRFWFKSLQSLTAHDRQFLQGNLFLLAVCMPLYLCSIFCSRSLVQVSTASCGTHPKLYPVTLTLVMIPIVYGYMAAGQVAQLSDHPQKEK